MKQITIVSEERPGLMAEISEALAAARVNIETLDGATIGDTAIIKMTVDRYDEALRALKDFNAVSEDALLVRLRDEPGALAIITRRFKDAGLTMQSIRIVRRTAGQSIVAIATERTEEAMALVRDVLLS